MKTQQPIGRLAMRQEGDYWNAYYALPAGHSESQKILIGSIRMAAVIGDEERKERFIDMMRDFISGILEKETGKRPLWRDPDPAPEHDMENQHLSRYKEIAAAINKAAVDDGKLIETGFDALRALAIAKDVPQIQVDEMRLAFMAGAQHLWAAMMDFLDPGSDETPADLQRMQSIQEELDRWEQKIRLRIEPSHGAG